MLSTTIHHVATLHRRPLTNASHFIYRCSSEVARQQVEPSIVNTSPTYGGAPESSATGLPQLQVILRNSSDNGSRHSRNLRRGGYVPGTIYGKDYENNVLKRLVIIRDKDLRRELRVWGTAFENTLFELSVVKLDGLDSKTCSTYEAKSEDKDQVIEKFVVVPRQTQLNPATDLPVSVNFLRYIAGKTKVRIPFRFINEDQNQDIKRGCFLVRLNRFVECVCEEEVPRDIVIDLTNVQKGDVIRLNSLKLPPKVRPTADVASDFVIGVVKTNKG